MRDSAGGSGPRGTLYLVPTPLDFGIAAAATPLEDVLPLGVLRRAASLRHWVCENAKTARAFLKRVDAVVPLSTALQALDIRELPRPRKGERHASVPDEALAALLAPALQGEDVGLCSEAGMPAVADPGAELVALAQREGVAVVPLVGPSALLLALAASGMNGQSFAFVGYLPVEEAARAARVRELEALARRQGQTQLMIETPYRNGALLQALLTHLGPQTRLSIACALTTPAGWTRTRQVQEWRRSPPALPNDQPAVFAIHGG
ncbi:SAM-dependent methyltransferase [Caldimonas aquatica]|uniref:SAM-dependent methyltransferase n=1 Tax=Caldimonas aquatica TaxID=376175 RepID=A0ABY6MU16_9BURK|nr:SAM-dependent methyltransferase [Schlegelella aquatica]UZD55513.1 SAM-dependent methyltransferase [Schlegelella aquatica]